MFGVSRMLLANKSASRETMYNVVTIAESTASPVLCSKGLRVLVDHSYDDHPPLDVVLVPGGNGTRAMANNKRLMAWLRNVAKSAMWVTSVCTGSLLLYKAGLANDKRVATHWMFEDDFEAMGATIARDADRFVVDGNIVTSQGVSAGIDMSLWLIGQLHSPEHARATQHRAQYYPKPPYNDDK
jgi:transcriptional regulator GlxA family with amidase domain